MAIRDIKKIPTYENNINTQVAQGQIQRTQQAQENPEYNNWGALGPIANGIASIGKSISSVFEQQDITRQNDNVAKMQKAYQLEIESKTADPREMKEIIADLDKWYIDYAEGLDLSEKDRKTLDTAALKYQTIRTQDWGARKAIANRELQGEQIQALLKEAEARNASVEELTQIVYGQNTAGRYPGNLADIADEYFDKKMLEAVHTDFEKKKLGEATVTGVGLQELKSTEIDAEALRQESYNYAKSLETQWNVEHKRDSIYSDLEADLLIRQSVKNRDFKNILDDYSTMNLGEAFEALDAEVIYDIDGNSIPLDSDQIKEIKELLIHKQEQKETIDLVEKLAATKAAYESFLDPNFDLEAFYKGETDSTLDAQQRVAVYNNFINQRENKTTRIQDVAYQEVGDVISDQLRQGRDPDDLYKYLLDNKDRMSYRQRRDLEAIIFPGKGNPMEDSKRKSELIVNAALRDVQLGLRTPADTMKILEEALATPEGEMYPDVWMDHFASAMDALNEDYGGESMKSALDILEGSDTFKDDPALARQVEGEVIDALRLAKKNDIVLTDKEVRQIVASAEERIGDEDTKNNIAAIGPGMDQENFFTTTDLQKSIKMALTGTFTGMNLTDPSKYHTLEIQFLDAFKGVTGYEYDGDVRVLSSGVPVFRVEGTDMVLDVSSTFGGVFANTKLVPLKQIREEYKNVDLGLQIGATEGVPGSSSERVVTKSGWHLRSEFRTQNIDGENYIVPQEYDESKNKYFDIPGEIVYKVVDTYIAGVTKLVPIYSDTSDKEAVLAEIEQYLYSPDELKKRQDEIDTAARIKALQTQYEQRMKLNQNINTNYGRSINLNGILK